MRQLLAFFCISVFSLYALLTWAHEAVQDELGCHEEETTGAYHCHTGRLAGRDFISKNEAMDALQALEQTANKDQITIKMEEPESERTAAPVMPPVLKITSWNLKNVGKSLFEYDRIANVMAGSDAISVQEVEFSPTGETSLLIIANLVQKKIGQKICKGWFKGTTGERARHAFLWKDSALALVEKTGEIRESCSDAPEVLRLEKKKPDPFVPYTQTFYLKSKKQIFVLASVYLAETKNPDKDVANVFKKLGSSMWPVIVSGEFKLKSKDSAFKEARKMGFSPAVTGKTQANFWVKNISVVQADPINLYEWYPDLKPKEIDTKIASRFPVVAEFSFSKPEADSLKMEVIKKKSLKKARENEAKVKATAKAAPAKAGFKPSSLQEDVESEAVESEAVDSEN